MTTEKAGQETTKADENKDGALNEEKAVGKAFRTCRTVTDAVLTEVAEHCENLEHVKLRNCIEVTDAGGLVKPRRQHLP